MIGVTLETRPDVIDLQEVAKLRSYGCTRLQVHRRLSLWIFRDTDWQRSAATPRFFGVSDQFVPTSRWYASC